MGLRHLIPIKTSIILAVLTLVVLTSSTTFQTPVVTTQAAELDILHSSYLGGFLTEGILAMTVANDGNIIVVGSTYSLDFPTLLAVNNDNAGGEDGFIAKFTPSSQMIWSTYFGAVGAESIVAVETDVNGNIIIAGTTSSGGFPLVNANDSTYAAIEGFVTKLDSTGNIIWSTFLGGSSQEIVYDLSVDKFGNIVVVGITYSNDFPLQNPIDSTFNGTNDGFMTVIDPNGVFTMSTYIGGISAEELHAVDHSPTSDSYYITGLTYSSDFPLLNAFDRNLTSAEAFLMKFDNQNQLNWSTAFGGESYDGATDVVVDSKNNPIIVGRTASSDLNLRNPYYSTLSGSGDVFIARFTEMGDLDMCGYFGGSKDEDAASITVDSGDNIIITGITQSSDIPIRFGNATSSGGGNDIYLSVFSNDGVLKSSTYLSSPMEDFAEDVIVDATGDIWIGGRSNSSDFPTINGYNKTHGGFYDGIFTKFYHRPPVETTTLQPQAQTITVTEEGENVTQTITQTTTQVTTTIQPGEDAPSTEPDNGGEDSFVGPTFQASIIAMSLILIPLTVLSRRRLINP